MSAGSPLHRTAALIVAGLVLVTACGGETESSTETTRGDDGSVTTTVTGQAGALGAVVIEGDWGEADHATRQGAALVGLGPEGARWLGDVPASFGHIESDTAGGIVFQPGSPTGDWSIYWIPAGSADRRRVVDVSGSDVTGDFGVVSWNGSPAILYMTDTILSGGEVGDCDECDPDVEPCGDCGVFVGEMNRVVRLQSLSNPSVIEVVDTVIQLGWAWPTNWISVDDYAAGRFEITKMDDHGCPWVEFWDESGQELDFPTAPALLDSDCAGEPRMASAGDLSRDGNLIVRVGPGAGNRTDLIVQSLANGRELHRIEYFRHEPPDRPSTWGLAHGFDGVDSITVLYGDVPDDGFATATVELVHYQWTGGEELSIARFQLPQEMLERIRRIDDGGCCTVTFLGDVDVDLTDLLVAG